jgi:hypothetical protein
LTAINAPLLTCQSMNPFSSPTKILFAKRLRRALQTDPVLTLEQLPQRTDLEFLGLSAETCFELVQILGFAHTTRTLKTSIGARVTSQSTFVCSSAKVARLTDWNLRQLAGLAATRHGLGIHADHWQLRALERTNQSDVPIPDALVHLFRATKPKLIITSSGLRIQPTRQVPTPEMLIAIEWDSGSTKIQEIENRADRYADLADQQIWLSPTVARAETIAEALTPIGGYASLAIDWRTGELLDLMLEDRDNPLVPALARVMNTDAPWRLDLLM